MSPQVPDDNFGRKPHQAELDLWAGSIPSDNDPSFQPLIKNPRPANRLFEPKDQHCGIWKDAPNKECHASFGDQGTTATVSCYGSLFQMSQFLGAGRSGLFSMDHLLTEEPYFVVDRAEFLNKLGSGFLSDYQYLSFGLEISQKYRPDPLPEVKWVNWRWPRYEWNVSDKRTSVHISSQWFIKNNTCFQQLVVTNTGKEPIYDFLIRAEHDMLIRDLDYLDDPPFNGKDDTRYVRGQGPNGFSWITANLIDLEESATGKENGPLLSPVVNASNSNNEGEKLESSAFKEEGSSKDQPTSPPQFSPAEHPKARTQSSQADIKLDTPSSDSQSSGSEEKAGDRQHRINTEGSQTAEQPSGDAPNKNRRRPSDDDLWQQRRIEDTWSARNPHAVVSIMSLFVDGTAEKMDGRWPRPARRTIEAAGSDSSVLEIVIAYKMLVIPKEKANWKNFLIPAEMADVSSMLAAETKELWGHSVTDDCNCNPPLFAQGIFTKERHERLAKHEEDSHELPSKNYRPDSHDVQTSTDMGEQPEATISSGCQTGARTEEDSTAVRLSDRKIAIKVKTSMPTSDNSAGEPQVISSVDIIEYLTWRHTEHILSVCTIPLTVPPLSHGEQANGPIDWEEGVCTSKTNASCSAKGEETEPGVPLAFTCGDMSGHRICTSASFFAFEFLTEVLRQLSSVKQTSFIDSLKRRINAACRGHIRWLEWVRKPWIPLEKTESLLGSGCFAANYWVSGQIMPEGGASWQPDNAVTDTAYQILKITAYVKWFRKSYGIQSLKDERLTVYMAILRDVWAYWIHELHDLDKRKACAWRHASKDGLNTFRLDDHMWLWNSLDELHHLDLWDLTEASSKTSKNSRWVSFIRSLSPEPLTEEESHQTSNSKRGNNQELFPDFGLKARRLSPKDVQRAVLQRFTVENDVSQERMLAVTRSARDTRFFFHTRDTTLFYGHRSGFFLPETSFGELWKRTIRSQSHHEESHREEWQSPLRLALGALAGLNGFSIDKRSPKELVKYSLQALIEASAHSAFIPGEIDATTREPSMFSEERDRDYYYHVGFEICSILLKYVWEFDLAIRSAEIRHQSPTTEQSKVDSPEVQREMKDLVNEILVQMKKQNPAKYSQGNDYRALSKTFGTDGRGDKRPAPTAMKKSMPFNNMIDTSSIINLEEEWLYNYPDFLVKKKIDLQHQLKLLFDETKKQYVTIYDSPSSVIDKALKALKRAPEEDFQFTADRAIDVDSDEDGLVASLPKQKNRRRRRGKRDIGASLERLNSNQFNRTLWESIGDARSSDTAKKRFLWLSSRSDPQTALLCWLATADNEKPAISLFFDRHAGYDNHVWDDTTMVLNTWQTELHMCFWVLCGTNLPVHEGMPFPMVAPWPRGNDKEFRRASIGFRFDGDFFDRYWTCHFIQYVPGLYQEYQPSSGTSVDAWRGFEQDKQWWQRKVLELQMVQHMLQIMLSSSKKILEEIEKELGLRKEKLIFSVLNREAYSTSAGHWQIYEELLGKAEEDISSSLNTLSKWVTREEDRGQERPRWTRNDERKYRGYINKLRNQTERQRWDLESSRDKIRKLKETLATRQTKIQSDLEAGREQNIRYFTYVTVIFLPLGFASSFYSMNGAPSNDLIASLAKFSAAAFAVTAVFLVSVGTFTALAAKALAGVKNVVLMVENKASSTFRQSIVLPFQRYSQGTRERSLLLRGIPASSVSSSAKSLYKVYPNKDWMASRWFWPAYLFLELPTRTVSSAWTAVRIGTLSPRAVWAVFLGIVVLPVYGMSRVVLFSFTNIVLLLRISRYLYRLSRKDRAKDDKKADEKKTMPEIEASDKQVQQNQIGDSEKNSADQSAIPDHFQRLIPTAEPLSVLQTLEQRLKQRLENVEMKDNATVQKESSET